MDDMSAHYVIPLWAMGNISHPAKSFSVCYEWILSPENLQFGFHWCIAHKWNFLCHHWKSKKDQGLYTINFQEEKHSFCGVYMMFLVKFWPFYCQFGHIYDQACIWGRIAYHFRHIRIIFKVESDSFNHEIRAGQVAQEHSHSQWLI